jgi:hypothetical protein
MSEAYTGSSYIYTSTDSGVTWTEQTAAGSRDWQAAALSADGMKVAAAAYNDSIYLGVTTQSNTPPVLPITPPATLPPAPASPPTVSGVSRANSPVTYTPSDPAPDETGAPTEPVAPVFDLQASSSYRSGGGERLKLSQGQIVDFNVVKAPHTVTIDSVTATGITFTLRSTPQTVTLKTGETGKYDVNDDNRPDIAITLLDISNGIANISFAAIQNPDTAVAAEHPSAIAHDQRKNTPLTSAAIIIGLVVIVIVIIGSIIRKKRRN